jgi:Amt family ammonium transporter
VQLLGMAVIAVIGFGLGAITCFILAKVTRFRPSEDDEFDGLDLAEHDIGAYPDFQQTTIKSYHLREA